MDEDTARDRLDLSDTVLSRWEPMGVPGGRNEDTMRMISEEVAILGQIGVEHPALLERASELVARYRALADKVNGGMN